MTTPPRAARPEVTRFAPSPTGLLHVGHARAALIAAEAAGGGRFLLRIEDIDRTRCRPEFTEAIFTDFAWLGFAWEQPVRRQSEHFADYEGALRRLRDRGLLYPCFCTRREIRHEVGAAVGAPQGPDGPIYPGTCRALSKAEAEARMAAGTPFAWRLDVARARGAAGALHWHDDRAGAVTATPEIFGDVLLGRKDTPASYHLACTWDDALQGITLVTRGEELFAATHVHRLLQALLDLPTPRYLHHGLILTPEGRKFAKSDKSVTIAALRAAGYAPEAVRRMAETGEEIPALTA